MWRGGGEAQLADVQLTLRYGNGEDLAIDHFVEMQNDLPAVLAEVTFAKALLQRH
jgi:hypothetical protein